MQGWEVDLPMRTLTCAPLEIDTEEEDDMPMRTLTYVTTEEDMPVRTCGGTSTLPTGMGSFHNIITITHENWFI